MCACHVLVLFAADDTLHQGRETRAAMVTGEGEGLSDRKYPTLTLGAMIGRDDSIELPILLKRRRICRTGLDEV